MSGYSNTPLVKKLGINPGDRIMFCNAPTGYRNLLGPTHAVEVSERVGDIDFIQIFTNKKSDYQKRLKQCKSQIKKDGMIWVSWPKKASKVETDLDENDIREFALEEGLVDVKVAAIDEVWSGLKLVYRKKDR